MSGKILIHNDGGDCQGTPLDANGKCPACGLTPDMQSIAIAKTVPHSFNEITDWLKQEQAKQGFTEPEMEQDHKGPSEKDTTSSDSQKPFPAVAKPDNDPNIEQFRVSVGFQIQFILHSGLDFKTAIDNVCSAAERLFASRSNEATAKGLQDTVVLVSILDCVACELCEEHQNA